MIMKRICRCFSIVQKLADNNKNDWLNLKSKIFIRNGNLRFEDSDLNMDLYLFNPSISMKNSNSFAIKEDSFVLSFSFTRKSSQQTNIITNSISQNQEYNHAVCLKYSQLVQLLQLEPKSNSQSIVIRQQMDGKKQNQKYLSVKDSPKGSQIVFTLKENINARQQSSFRDIPSILQFHISYMNYRIFKNLLKDCLFDLSGQRIAYDIKRIEGIRHLQKDMVLNRKQIHQQVDEYFNKMN